MAKQKKVIEKKIPEKKVIKKIVPEKKDKEMDKRIIPFLPFVIPGICFK